jgi:hypothetical protein
LLNSKVLGVYIVTLNVNLHKVFLINVMLVNKFFIMCLQISDLYINNILTIVSDGFTTYVLLALASAFASITIVSDATV